MNRYKRFLLTLLTLTTLSLGLVVLFNYTVDSAGLFHKNNIMQQVAKELLAGKIVAGFGDEAFDDRQFQLSLIKEIHSKVDIIATGSSRTKELRKRYVTDGTKIFFNHAVNGASMEDYIAILGAYKLYHGYIPKDVILGVDPWILNKNSGRIRWKNIQKYHDFERQIFPTITKQRFDTLFILKKYKELLNYSYTLANIRYLLKSLKTKKPYYIANDLEVNDFLREPDASLHYPYTTRFPNVQDVYTKALQYTQGYVYGLENFQDTINKKKFEDILCRLKQEGVHVTLFLAPYHPLTYDILVKQPKYKLKSTEAYFRKVAKNNNLQIIGSYNPHTLHLKENDFFDGMHCNDRAIKQIFSSWKPANAP